MIEAQILFEDGSPVARGLFRMPAIPPVGGHISVIDMNGNRCILCVTDVIIGAASIPDIEALPNIIGTEMKVTILGAEAFGHLFSD